MAESLKKVAASGKEKAVSAGQAAISGMNALSTSATDAVGIAQPQSNTPGETSKEGASPRLDADVLVLGAGISGLAAAAELVKRGNKVIVLEARDRTGGRIDSRAIGPQDSEAVRVDMGASFVHGKYDNPIYDLTQKLGIPVHYTSPEGEIRILDADGQMGEDLANRLGFNVSHTFFDASRSFAQDHDPARTDSLASYVFAKNSPLFDGLDQEAELRENDSTASKPPDARWKAKALGRSFSGWTGASLEDVALRWWGFERDTIGPDGMVTSGRYHEVVDHLADLVTKDAGQGEIRMLERVDRVRWNSSEDVVTVSTSQVDSGHSKPGYREYRASSVICTLPLGVLQRQPPTFEPRLPPRKQRAIRSLGYGLLSKIAIRYDKAWWKESDKTTSFFILPRKGHEEETMPPCSAEQKASLKPQGLMVQNFVTIDGAPQLVMFLGADYGHAMEASDHDDCVRWAHELFVRYLSPDGLIASDISTPSGSVASSWSTDPYSFNSYTYIPSKVDEQDSQPVTPLDIAEFAVPAWKGSLGFAGEHTHQDRYASVHGAYESGVREGKRVGIALEMERKGEE